MEESKQLKKERNALLGCIAVVEFDIDVGQVVRHLYPKSCLSPVDEKAICHMSFPDSNAFTQHEGQMEYIFRLRISNGLGQSNRSGMNSLIEDSRQVFGFTCFKQRKDKDNSRGYKQQSVVILSKYPLLNFISSLARIIANSTILPEEETSIQKIIEDSFEEIRSWSIARNGGKNTWQFRGSQVDLEVQSYLKIIAESDIPVMGGEVEESILKEEESKQNENDVLNTNGKNEEKDSRSLHGIQSVLSGYDCAQEGYFQELNIFRALKRDKVHLLWKLWEIALTNQPLMIVADTPLITSQLVLSAISLISPIEYVGDFKPYFTIYDSEYNTIKSRCDSNISRNILIGVTNPFFLKTLSKFPVILQLDSAFEAQINSKKEKKNADEKFFPFNVNSKSMKINIEFDKNLERILLPGDSAETDAINNSVVRKQFRLLTNQFIAVFEDYFNSKKNDIKIFDKKEFVKFLDKCKFPFADLFEKKKRIISLYEKFMLSDNFLNYIKSKENIYFSKAPLQK